MFQFRGLSPKSPPVATVLRGRNMVSIHRETPETIKQYQQMKEAISSEVYNHGQPLH